MGKSRSFDRRCRLAARFREGRLWLAPDVRCEIVAAMLTWRPVSDPFAEGLPPVPPAPSVPTAWPVPPAPSVPGDAVFAAASAPCVASAAPTAAASTPCAAPTAPTAATLASAFSAIPLGGFGLSADRRAFDGSIACERLADLFLLLDAPAAALRCLQQAAWVALCGEAYDHGEVSLPARFLRIRFVRLFERVVACRASDPRLRRLPLDPWLEAELRRVDAEYL